MRGGRPADKLDMQCRLVLDFIQELLVLPCASMEVFPLLAFGWRDRKLAAISRRRRCYPPAYLRRPRLRVYGWRSPVGGPIAVDEALPASGYKVSGSDPPSARPRQPPAATTRMASRNATGTAGSQRLANTRISDHSPRRSRRSRSAQCRRSSNGRSPSRRA
jgi:hypothetical protein